MAKIKTQSIWSTLEEGDKVTGPFERVIKTFDSEGKLLLEEERGASGAVVHKEECQYDAEGRKIRSYKLFAEEGMEETLTWEYTEDGKVDKEVGEFFGGLKTIKRFTYAGNQVSVVLEDEEGNLEGKEEVWLDDEGREVKKVAYDEEGTLKAQVETEYDTAGLKTRVEARTWDGAFSQEWMFEYTSDGKLAIEKELNEAGYIVLQKKNEYNDAGNLLLHSEEDLRTREKLTRKYELDEAGNTVKEYRYVADTPEPEAIASYEYEGGELVKQVITSPYFTSINEYKNSYFEE